MTRRGGTYTQEDVQVVVTGAPNEQVAEHVRRKISALRQYVSEPILHARVRLSRAPNPAVERPVIAQGNLVVNGRLARAQVAAATIHEAVDLLQARLRQRVVKLARHWQARRGSVPTGDEWRHGQLPAERPEYFPRPPEERQVVRRKTFAPTEATPLDAVADMELLDYDFYLFTDRDTGQDAVVYRAPPTGYRLAELEPPPPTWPEPAVPITVSPHPAPRLSLPEAIERLNLTGLPFVFFADAETGRGHVLYRRYDGHYGLISPATS